MNHLSARFFPAIVTSLLYPLLLVMTLSPCFSLIHSSSLVPPLSPTTRIRSSSFVVALHCKAIGGNGDTNRESRWYPGDIEKEPVYLNNDNVENDKVGMTTTTAFSSSSSLSSPPNDKKKKKQSSKKLAEAAATAAALLPNKKVSTESKASPTKKKTNKSTTKQAIGVAMEEASSSLSSSSVVPSQKNQTSPTSSTAKTPASSLTSLKARLSQLFQDEEQRDKHQSIQRQQPHPTALQQQQQPDLIIRANGASESLRQNHAVSVWSSSSSNRQTQQQLSASSSSSTNIVSNMLMRQKQQQSHPSKVSNAQQQQQQQPLLQDHQVENSSDNTITNANDNSYNNDNHATPQRPTNDDYETKAPFTSPLQFTMEPVIERRPNPTKITYNNFLEDDSDMDDDDDEFFPFGTTISLSEVLNNNDDNNNNDPANAGIPAPTAPIQALHKEYNNKRQGDTSTSGPAASVPPRSLSATTVLDASSQRPSSQTLDNRMPSKSSKFAAVFGAETIHSMVESTNPSFKDGSKIIYNVKRPKKPLNAGDNVPMGTGDVRVSASNGLIEANRLGTTGSLPTSSTVGLSSVSDIGSGTMGFLPTSSEFSGGFGTTGPLPPPGPFSGSHTSGTTGPLPPSTAISSGTTSGTTGPLPPSTAISRDSNVGFGTTGPLSRSAVLSGGSKGSYAVKTKLSDGSETMAPLEPSSPVLARPSGSFAGVKVGKKALWGSNENTKQKLTDGSTAVSPLEPSMPITSSTNAAKSGYRLQPSNPVGLGGKTKLTDGSETVAPLEPSSTIMAPPNSVSSPSRPYYWEAAPTGGGKRRLADGSDTMAPLEPSSPVSPRSASSGPFSPMAMAARAALPNPAGKQKLNDGSHMLAPLEPSSHFSMRPAAIPGVTNKSTLKVQPQYLIPGGKTKLNDGSEIVAPLEQSPQLSMRASYAAELPGQSRVGLSLQIQQQYLMPGAKTKLNDGSEMVASLEPPPPFSFRPSSVTGQSQASEGSTFPLQQGYSTPRGKTKLSDGSEVFGPLEPSLRPFPRPPPFLEMARPPPLPPLYTQQFSGQWSMNEEQQPFDRVDSTVPAVSFSHSYSSDHFESGWHATNEIDQPSMWESSFYDAVSKAMDRPLSVDSWEDSASPLMHQNPYASSGPEDISTSEPITMVSFNRRSEPDDLFTSEPISMGSFDSGVNFQSHQGRRVWYGSPRYEAKTIRDRSRAQSIRNKNTAIDVDASPVSEDAANFPYFTYVEKS